MSPPNNVPIPAFLVTIGGTQYVTTDGITLYALGGGGSLTLGANGLLTGAGTAGSPLTAVSQFGSDTSIPINNSSAAPVTAVELVASLPTNTAGSEASEWLVKLLDAGTAENAFAILPTGIQVDSRAGGRTTWSQRILFGGSEVARISANSAGQLLISGTQAAGGIRFYTGIETGLAFQIGSTGAIECLNTGFMTAQGANIASANNLTLNPAQGTGGSCFNITGGTQVNLISEAAYNRGSQVVLVATTPTVFKNAFTASGSFVPIQFASNADFTTTATNAVLDLVLMGTNSGAGPDIWYCKNH
jgi:hypothetical protein